MTTRLFVSDNSAAVHPHVWEAMRAADAPDMPYDGDALSQGLDARFSALFRRECAVVWAGTGTAANALALACLTPPYGGIVCHYDAHVEADEGGAPEFFTHGAKLMLADGEGAKVTPETVAAVIDPIRDDVHRVQPVTLALTQATEQGRVYTPDELAALTDFARGRGLRVHLDGARFANAVAHLGCSPAEAAAVQGIDSLSFGFIKNGGMGAEALLLFDTALADQCRRRHKRAGQLQSKGRYMAAQLHAMLDDDIWLENGRAANRAARIVAEAAPERLLDQVDANEVFMRLSAAERESLRSQGFAFYDWSDTSARFVTAWNTSAEDADALAKALAAL